MPARVLVVDDVPMNVKMLEAKLSTEYFNVISATDGEEALDLIVREDPDIVLLDVMMPGMDGFEVCRQIKGNDETAHIPVVMVTALGHPEDRVEGLKAGADDFITKPIDDVALFARVKSLVRLKMLTDELRLRRTTGKQLGAAHASLIEEGQLIDDAQILIVESALSDSGIMAKALEPLGSAIVEREYDKVAELVVSQNVDLIVLGLEFGDDDGLRLCSNLLSADNTRSVPQLMIVDQDDRDGLIKGLELGVTDYVVRPLDHNELTARAKTQIKRKRYSDRLRNSVTESLTLAVTDPLTGLHNRRYMAEHLGALMKNNAESGKTVTLLIADVDYFKEVNDRHGHIVGDQVLRELAQRIARNIRGLDLACRYGGEEFVIIMPDADPEFAASTAERLRRVIADEPFSVEGMSSALSVTASIGYAASSSELTSPDRLIERADSALYQAKDEGRNRVKKAA